MSCFVNGIGIIMFKIFSKKKIRNNRKRKKCLQNKGIITMKTKRCTDYSINSF